jgi:hypothetical protein
MALNQAAPQGTSNPLHDVQFASRFSNDTAQSMIAANVDVWKLAGTSGRVTHKLQAMALATVSGILCQRRRAPYCGI